MSILFIILLSIISIAFLKIGLEENQKAASYGMIGMTLTILVGVIILIMIKHN